MRGLAWRIGLVVLSVWLAAEQAGAEALYVQDGTYRIESFRALEELAELVAGADEPFSGEVWLMNDIEAERPLRPIGDPQSMFQGVFDGRGHVISNLRLTGDGEFRGLFGVIGERGAVKNLTLRRMRAVGERYTGAVAAYSAGSVVDCRVEDSRIVGRSEEAYGTATGGVVGLSCGRIEGCVGYGTVVAACRNVGGIVGSQCAGAVEGCVGLNDVRSRENGRALAGGIAGSVQTGGTVRRCIDAGDVRAPRAAWAGGTVGGLLSGKLSGCLSLSRVEGREAGGIAGFAAQHAQVMNCRYVARKLPGVGEGRQAGVEALEQGRRFGVVCERLIPHKAGSRLER